MSKGISRREAKPNLKRIRFCFDYLQADHPKFSISSCSKEYMEALLRQIIRYSAWTTDEFMDMNNDEHRHCTSTFKETSEPDGFSGIDPYGEDVWTNDAWQFDLCGTYGHPSAGWRVHGFISDNMFHIVWLDPDHKLNLHSEFHESKGIQSLA